MSNRKFTESYQYCRHNKNLLLVHLTFVTKYRKKILCDHFREEVKQFIYYACIDHHWYIQRMETDQDRIHIILQYNPTDSITKIVLTLKQLSTWQAWKQNERLLKQYYWKEHTLLSDGYFAASVGTVSKTVIEQYIEHQG